MKSLKLITLTLLLSLSTHLKAEVIQQDYKVLQDVPSIIVPRAVFLPTYPNETGTSSIELIASNLEHNIHLSLANGNNFSIDKEEIIVENGAAEEIITITYTPVISVFDEDTLLVESEGVAPILVRLTGNIMQDRLYMDFENSKFPNVESDYISDGWEVKNGRVTLTNPTNYLQGSGGGDSSLILFVNNERAGSITSPAKSGGIRNIEFYYRSNFNPSITFTVNKSSDGETWENIDTVATVRANNGHSTYSKTVNDPDAKWLRIQAEKTTSSSDAQLYIDSIVVDAMSYLRRVGDIVQMDATKDDVPLVIPVKVAGLLNAPANISLEKGMAYTLSKQTVEADDVADGAVASFNVTFNALNESEYEDMITITNDELGLERQLVIPIFVNFIKPSHLELLGEEIRPQNVIKMPATVFVEFDGFLNSAANITLAGGEQSPFRLSKTAIEPEEIAIYPSSFKASLDVPESGVFNDIITISGGELAEDITIPISITYTKPALEDDATIIAECDFETQGSFAGWKSYDLDGKSLAFFFSGTPKAWFWKYESDKIQGNSVIAASSVFLSNTQDETTPANDWLFTLPLEITTTKNYYVSWNARSLMGLFPDDYEVRVIEDAKLTELEESFTEQTTLAEVSEILVNNSDILLSVQSETEEWRNYPALCLNAYKGKTIRLIWRYISDNMHTVYVDDFKFYSTPDTTVNINVLRDNNISVYASPNGYIYIQGAPVGTPVSVVNLQGQTLFASTIKSNNERLNIDLRNEIYIVKAGGKVCKVVGHNK